MKSLGTAVTFSGCDDSILRRHQSSASSIKARLQPHIFSRAHDLLVLFSTLSASASLQHTMSDAGSSLGPAFLGAFEGSVSVLLTLSVGYVVGRMGVLDHNSVHRMTKLCSNLFLP